MVNLAYGSTRILIWVILPLVLVSIMNPSRKNGGGESWMEKRPGSKSLCSKFGHRIFEVLLLVQSQFFSSFYRYMYIELLGVVLLSLECIRLVR